MIKIFSFSKASRFRRFIVVLSSSILNIASKRRLLYEFKVTCDDFNYAIKTMRYIYILSKIILINMQAFRFSRIS